MLHDSLQPELSTSFDVGPPPLRRARSARNLGEEAGGAGAGRLGSSNAAAGTRLPLRCCAPPLRRARSARNAGKEALHGHELDAHEKEFRAERRVGPQAASPPWLSRLGEVRIGSRAIPSPLSSRCGGGRIGFRTIPSPPMCRSEGVGAGRRDIALGNLPPLRSFRYLHPRCDSAKPLTKR